MGRIDSQSGLAYTFDGAEAMDFVSLIAGKRTITDRLCRGHELLRMCNRVQVGLALHELKTNWGI